MILQIPPELYTTILTYLRATDLSSLQQTCTTFSNRTLIQDVITTFASQIYPPELTRGYDTPAISGELPSTYEEKPSYELLRNMEMVIVARVLSRPEPSLNERRGKEGCFYVSKAWCKAALKWLEVVEEQRKERYKLKLEAAKEKAVAAAAAETNSKKKHHVKKSKKQTKKMKKEERRRNRKLSDTSPPWPNVNHDITCEHGFLKVVGGDRCIHINQSANNHDLSSQISTSTRSSRAKRRLMDKQAWKVLKKLYPEGIQLSSVEGECIQCTMEAEAKKRNIEMKKIKEQEERKKPLQNVHVRKFYSRTNKSGVPKECLKYAEGEYENKFALNVNPMKIFPTTCDDNNVGVCPLVSGVYYILPRAWCHKWRKYIKSGEGGRPCAPDSSSCLCDAHRLPLIPPHLESFLYGETSSLLGTGIDLTASMMTGNDCYHFDGGTGGSSGEMFSSPVASTSNNASANSNIMTIHDLNNNTLIRSASATTSSSLSTTSTPMTSPRPLPVGFNPIDQRLGGSVRRTRSNSNSYSNFSSSPMPMDRRSRSDSQTNLSSPATAATATTDTLHIMQLPQSQEDSQMISTLRASGLSESEIQLQRLAMLQIEEEQQRHAQYLQQQQQNRMHAASSTSRQPSLDGLESPSTTTLMSPEELRANLNAKLDYENRVVVEILTEDEFTALEQWWPEIHSSYALKFAILDKGCEVGGKLAGGRGDGSEIVWTTSPCRHCDATGYHSNHEMNVRNRSRRFVNNSSQKKKKRQ